MKKLAIYSLTAVTGAILAAGCGSGGGAGGGASTSTTLTGNVNAPPDQVASLPARHSLVAMLSRDFLGSPADAVVPGGNRGLANAQVRVLTRVDHQLIAGPVTTNSDGSFTITIPPTSQSLILDVTSANGGLELRARIPHGVTSVSVDEVSTVGTQVAEQAEANGADSAEADQVAAQAESDQQAAENDPSQVPDLHTGSPNPNRRPDILAEVRLTGNFGGKLGDAVGNSNHAPSRRQAVMAALAYARVHLGADPAVIGHDWVRALVNGPATYSDQQMAAALVAGGVTAATAAQVDSAVAALNTTLGPVLGHTFTDNSSLPAPLFILIALNSSSNPLQVATLAGMDAAVSSLTGSTVHSTPSPVDQGGPRLGVDVHLGMNGSGNGAGGEGGATSSAANSGGDTAGGSSTGHVGVKA